MVSLLPAMQPWVSDPSISSIRKEAGDYYTNTSFLGLTVVSVYFSPNITLMEFRDSLGELEDELCALPGSIIMVRDKHSSPRMGHAPH